MQLIVPRGSRVVGPFLATAIALVVSGTNALAGASGAAPLPGAAVLPPIPDEGMISPVHQKYAGQIVFSKQYIDRSLKSDAAFTKKFVVTDSIFARPLLRESLMNALRRRGINCTDDQRFGQSITVQVDGEADRTKWTTIHQWFFADENFKQDTTMIPVRDKESDTITKKPFWGAPVTYDEKSVEEAHYGLTVLISRLAPGRHMLAFHHSAFCDDTSRTAEAATGEIALTVDAAGLAAMLAKNGPKLPASKNAEAARLVPIYMKEFNAVNGTPKKVTMPSTQWDYVTNTFTGVYEARKTDLVVGYKKSAGDCYVVGVTAEHYASDGRKRVFSPNNVKFYTGTSYPIPCQTLQ
jgi:hypothetical protein